MDKNCIENNHTVEYYSVMKKEQTTDTYYTMEESVIMLSERSRTKGKNGAYVLFHLNKILAVPHHGDRKISSFLGVGSGIG